MTCDFWAEFEERKIMGNVTGLESLAYRQYWWIGAEVKTRTRAEAGALGGLANGGGREADFSAALLTKT